MFFIIAVWQAHLRIQHLLRQVTIDSFCLHVVTDRCHTVDQQGYDTYCHDDCDGIAQSLIFAGLCDVHHTFHQQRTHDAEQCKCHAHHEDGTEIEKPLFPHDTHGSDK